jgi:hypothetical protein
MIHISWSAWRIPACREWLAWVVGLGDHFSHPSARGQPTRKRPEIAGPGSRSVSEADKLQVILASTHSMHLSIKLPVPRSCTNSWYTVVGRRPIYSLARCDVRIQSIWNTSERILHGRVFAK